jgi:hypothetical protein
MKKLLQAAALGAGILASSESSAMQMGGCGKACYDEYQARYEAREAERAALLSKGNSFSEDALIIAAKTVLAAMAVIAVAVQLDKKNHVHEPGDFL